MKISLSRAGLVLIVLAILTVLLNSILSRDGVLAVLSGTVSRQLIPLLLMGAALGTDAMSLSIGIGLRGVSWRDVIRVSAVIGIFHIVMPLVGALAGHYFGLFVGSLAVWIGAAIVAFIGVRMIWGCVGSGDAGPCSWKLTGFSLLMLATGVSIDALSVGFSLGTFGYSIYVTSVVFGIFGAAMTAIGLLFGSRLGKFIGDRGELVGGCVLIILAVHMLFEG